MPNGSSLDLCGPPSINDFAGESAVNVVEVESFEIDRPLRKRHCVAGCNLQRYVAGDVLTPGFHNSGESHSIVAERLNRYLPIQPLSAPNSRNFWIVPSWMKGIVCAANPLSAGASGPR